MEAGNKPTNHQIIYHSSCPNSLWFPKATAHNQQAAVSWGFPTYSMEARYCILRTGTQATCRLVGGGVFAVPLSSLQPLKGLATPVY